MTESQLNIRNILSLAYAWTRPVVMTKYLDERYPRIVVGRAEGSVVFQGHVSEFLGADFAASASWMDCGVYGREEQSVDIKIKSRMSAEYSTEMVIPAFRQPRGLVSTLNPKSGATTNAGVESFYFRAQSGEDQAPVYPDGAVINIQRDVVDPSLILALNALPKEASIKKSTVFGDVTYIPTLRVLTVKISRTLAPGQLPHTPPAANDARKSIFHLRISDTDTDLISQPMDVLSRDAYLVGVRATGSVKAGILELQQDEEWLVFLDVLPVMFDDQFQPGD